MGQKGGGGGRVGFGTATNKGPKSLGGRLGAGGRVTGGGTGLALMRAAGGNPAGKQFTLANLQRQAGLSQAQALAEADRLVAAGQAEYTYLSDTVAAVLKGNGRDVAYRGGRPVKGIKVTGNIA